MKKKKLTVLISGPASLCVLETGETPTPENVVQMNAFQALRMKGGLCYWLP